MESQVSETAPGTDDGATVAAETPAPSWEPIATAPRDGRDVHVRYGEDDDNGRLVRWRNGRHFTGRRWVVGGSWSPSNATIPLPLGEPSEWLDYHEPQPEAEPGEAAA